MQLYQSQFLHPVTEQENHRRSSGTQENKKAHKGNRHNLFTKVCKSKIGFFIREEIFWLES